MNENMQIIKDLITEIDSASKGVSTKFAQVDMEKKLQDQMIEVFGKANPSYKDIKRSPNSGEFFAILEEYIGEASSSALELAIPFAEFRGIAWGDTTRFEIENSDLFDVCTVAKGNGNIRRQRIENGFLPITTEAKGIKIFDNFKRFLAGKVNWTAMVQKVTDSYVKHVKELVYLAFYASTPVSGNAVFNVNDAGGFAIDNAYEIVEHVQAENFNSDVLIIGTRIALKNFTPVIATEQANKDMYETGYYKSAEGYNLVPIDQMHKGGTFDFLLDNQQVMIVPANLGGIVKILEEGEPIITDTPIGQNADMSVEHMFYREVGVAVVTGAKYGKYSWIA